jgi:hypothetical protein
MNAIAGIVSDAHTSAQETAGEMTAQLPLIIRIPVGILVWMIAFVRAIVIGLLGLLATLAAVAFVAHAIFNQGKSGVQLFQNWLEVAQQNLGGWQLASASAALGLTTAAWLYKSSGTIGKIEHIVHKARHMFGLTTEDPELADLKSAAEKHGYRLIPKGADPGERPMT